MMGPLKPGEIRTKLREKLNLSDEEIAALLQSSEARPDRFFTLEQQHRLKELFEGWRRARDTGATFSADEEEELERLTVVESRASGLRAKALFEELQKRCSGGN